MPSDPDTVRRAASPDAVLEDFQRLMFLLRSQMHHKPPLKDRPPAGDGQDTLAPMEARALHFFARHPGATSSDLVTHSGRDKAQVARLIKGLLERQLLQREADETDRRSHRLMPTAQGLAVHRGMQQQRAQLSRRLIDGLGPQELAQLSALLAHMLRNLDEPAAPPGR